MEADVRSLRRIRGQLPGAKILLADCGLSTEARALADYLAQYRAEGCPMVSHSETYRNAYRPAYRVVLTER